MLLCLSASHQSADFSILEKLSTVDRDRLDALLAGIDGVDGGVVLATCNRFELYLEVADVDALLPRLWPELARVLGVAESTLRQQLAIVRDRDVPSYLFSVSSGLESVVVGEGEISGQVRRALDEARAAALTTTRLEQLFQRAASTSRGVKMGTGLQSQGRSLVRFALDLAESQISDWAGTHVLLIGTGNYAGASLKALRDRGVREVAVYSPSGQANRFAEREGVVPVSDNDYLERVASADLIVTCTNAEHVLDFEDMHAARLAPGRSSATLVIDMGMPRNVDPMVARLDSVDVLDLETIRMHAPVDTLDATAEARCIVARAAAEFHAAEAEAELHHAIAALRRHVTDIAEDEVDREGDRLGERGPAALRRLANTILHEPTVRAKQLAREGRGQEFLDAIELLFGVSAPELEPGARELPEAGACPYLAAQRAGNASATTRPVRAATDVAASPMRASGCGNSVHRATAPSAQRCAECAPTLSCPFGSK